jgi:myo-inositol-1(or 4)-monophosphatase
MSHILDTAAGIAREAGAIINDFARQRIGFELKGDYDLVTAADKASEKLIVQRLLAQFPDHSIVAEEGGGTAGFLRVHLVRRSARRHDELCARLSRV